MQKFLLLAFGPDIAFGEAGGEGWLSEEFLFNS